jgi:peroxiredoxin
MIVDDGVVTFLGIDEKGIEESAAEKVLSLL